MLIAANVQIKHHNRGSEIARSCESSLAYIQFKLVSDASARITITSCVQDMVMSAGGGSAGAYGSSQGVKDVLGSLLSVVTLISPTDQEQLAIMKGLFPDLARLLPCAMMVLHLVKRAAGQLTASQAATL